MRDLGVERAPSWCQGRPGSEVCLGDGARTNLEAGSLQGTKNPEKSACPEISPTQAHSSHETRKIAHVQYDRNKYT